MKYVIQSTKTSAGTRKLPITDDVAEAFARIIEERPKPKVNRIIRRRSG